MRTLVIGDIHGGLKALIQLFERANVIEDDQLIFLGDYVDGWSDSAPLIDFLIELRNKNDCIFVKGNHDIWCEEWLKTGTMNRIWLMHGGQETVDSYLGYTLDQKAKHVDFFASMPFYYISATNDLFIHAGFTSMHGPEKEFHSSNYNWDRTLWEVALGIDNKLERTSPYFPKRLALFNEIYIGHTPTLSLGIKQPVQASNVWNIDTGAAFSGMLSCMNIKTKEIFQSEPVHHLYPNEKGRMRK